MNDWKRLIGLALIAIGASLLVVCKVAGWQSNTELLIGLLVIILGFFLHVRLQK